MLVLLGIWEGRRSIWLTLIVVFLFILAFFAGKWEISIYKKKQLELEVLHKKLQEEGELPAEV